MSTRLLPCFRPYLSQDNRFSYASSIVVRLLQDMKEDLPRTCYVGFMCKDPFCFFSHLFLPSLLPLSYLSSLPPIPILSLLSSSHISPPDLTSFLFKLSLPISSYLTCLMSSSNLLSLLFNLSLLSLLFNLSLLSSSLLSSSHPTSLLFAQFLSLPPSRASPTSPAVSLHASSHCNTRFPSLTMKFSVSNNHSIGSLSGSRVMPAARRSAAGTAVGASGRDKPH
eukprot:766271-Hanusia_phi.AAC.5